MEILTVKNGVIPKVVNGSFLYIDKKYNNNFINGRHYPLDIGLYIGYDNRWLTVKKDVIPNDVIDFTYDGDTNVSLLLKDKTSYNIELNNVKVSFNFQPGTTSYTYIVPYDLIFTSAETSGPTYTITKSSVTYEFGSQLNQFDELLIQVNTDGLIILNGIKV